MIVQRRHFEAVIEQRRHHRIHFLLGEDEVAHHHVHAAGPLCHRHPAAESKRRWRLDAGDGHADVIARDVHLEDAGLEVALLAERGEHLLIVGGHILRAQPPR